MRVSVPASHAESSARQIVGPNTRLVRWASGSFKTAMELIRPFPIGVLWNAPLSLLQFGVNEVNHSYSC
jgi:hypothetical protein